MSDFYQRVMEIKKEKTKAIEGNIRELLLKAAERPTTNWIKVGSIPLSEGRRLTKVFRDEGFTIDDSYLKNRMELCIGWGKDEDE